MNELLLAPRPQRAQFSAERAQAGLLQRRGPVSAPLAAALDRANGWLKGKSEATVPVRFAVDDPSEAPPALDDDESYRLELSNDGMRISAPRLAGARHALASLVQISNQCGHLPLGHIEDAPSFPWRGLMLDPARRFLSLDALLATLDAMALCKLNVLHLHLTDDQGFRFQSRAYPKLASAESYSREELRTLVTAATDRGIRIIPELDLPGHATSWLCAHPEWGPRRSPVAPSDRFGVHEAVLNPIDPAVLDAVDTLIGELAEVFPDPFIHIGGDEVNPTWWNESTEISSHMADQGLDGPTALQARFNQRLAEFAARHGKRIIGWDEALEGGAPDGMVVQSWRGATARNRALAAGHDCVLSSGYYLDLFYPADVHHAYALDASEEELLALEDAMLEDPRFDHVAAGLKWTQGWRRPAPSSGTGRVLGGEACLWSELVSEELLPVRLWSRLPAIADRFWSNQPAPSDFGRWVEASLSHFAAAGVVDVQQTSRTLLRWFGVKEAHLPAVALLEPIKWYGRLLGQAALEARLSGQDMPQSRPYGTHTPLNRPVDALLPESLAARRFEDLLADGGRALIDECTRLLDVCAAEDFIPELTAPIANLKLILQTVVEVATGRLSQAEARPRIAEASAPAGEYIVAIAPQAQAWLQAP